MGIFRHIQVWTCWQSNIFFFLLPIFLLGLQKFTHLERPSSSSSNNHSNLSFPASIVPLHGYRFGRVGLCSRSLRQGLTLPQTTPHWRPIKRKESCLGTFPAFSETNPIVPRTRMLFFPSFSFLQPLALFASAAPFPTMWPFPAFLSARWMCSLHTQRQRQRVSVLSPDANLC